MSRNFGSGQISIGLSETCAVVVCRTLRASDFIKIKGILIRLYEIIAVRWWAGLLRFF